MTATSDDTLLATLAKQIRDQLDRGTSLDAIVQQLAGSLATQVAAQLGISTQTSRERLTQTFTAALSATGQGPPATTNAERASALATRFGQLTKLAARVTNGEAGPSIRTIAGTSLDADTAGADPTPNTTSVGSPSQTHETSPIAASPLIPSPIAGPSDGRTVAIASAQAISSGGDTLLGRIVARAYLAGDQAAPNAPVPARAASSTTSTNGSASATAQNAVETFVRAFDAALTREDDSHRAAGGDTAPAAPGSASHAPAPVNDQPTVPFAIAVAHANEATTTIASGSTPAQAPPVDPQAVVEQVVRAMAVQTAGDGTSTVRLRLVPEHLGDVSVKLVVFGGSVDATLTAHSADAQNALAGGQAQLAKTLADAGLKLQSFTVGLAGGGFGGTRDQSSHERANAQFSPRRIVGLANDGVDAPSDDDLLAVPSFGPPIYTPSGSLGALNYLV